ncbi:Cysteine desulfurase [hydrothermal vent metagenome]|uniref:Cysteine desulfurase n=1 Tax=hydrothermal vent metagenome TaxID=652676 RepID=A0A3B1DGC4_9ZZZZ
MIYLDNNATTKPSEAVAQAVSIATATLFANPSSVHRPGQEARHAIELTRKELAALLGVPPKELTLTSTGTESIDLAIRGVLEANATNRGTGFQPVRPARSTTPTQLPNIITTPLEHPAVAKLLQHLARRGVVEPRLLPLDSRGMADPESLLDLLDANTILVSVQWANNETGVIQPIERFAELCRARSLPLHCDAVQWVGKMPMPAEGPPCDLLSFSPHKFHGPKGVGGLWVRRGVGLIPQTIGSQELARRGGTENVAGIIGAGVAAQEAAAWLADPARRAACAARRDRFERAILDRVPGAAINSHDSPRLWNTANIAFPTLEAEAMLMLLSERGLAASAGSACSSGSLEPSPILRAMGIPDRLAHGSIRFSLSKETTDAEIDQAIEIVVAAATQLGRSSAASL